MKYIYDPPDDRWTPNFVVGEEYEGDFANNPCFKPVTKKEVKPKKETEKGEE